MKAVFKRTVTIEETFEIILAKSNSSSSSEEDHLEVVDNFSDREDHHHRAISCCVDSNGQADESPDIDNVLRFDNTNFSSPESTPRSRPWQNDHIHENTCQIISGHVQQEVTQCSNSSQEMSSGNEVQLQQQDEDESHLASPLRRLSDLAHGHGQASPNQTTLKAHQEKPQVRVLPKWQIVSAANTPAGSGQPPQRRIASLKPGSAPQKATLLTKSGPQDVCILKSKAISCPRTGRYRCPVPNCKIDGRSRVGVAKHFRRDHKDYRSWRDVFIKRDAPDFILRNNEGQENTLGPHQQENPNPEQQGLLMISEGLDNCQPSDSSADPITRPFLPNAAAVQHQAQAVIIPTAPQAFPYPSSYFGANQVIYIQPVLPATFQPESQAIFVQMAPGQPLTSQFVIQPTNTTHSSSLQVMPASVALAAPAMSFHQQQLEGNSTTRLNSSPQTPQPILLQPSNNLVFGSQDGHTFVTVVPQAQTFSVNMP